MQFRAVIALVVVACASPARAQEQDDSLDSQDAGLKPDGEIPTVGTQVDAKIGSSVEAEVSDPGSTPVGPEAPGGQDQGQVVAKPQEANPQDASRIDTQADAPPAAPPYRLEGVVQARYVYQNASGGSWQGSFEPPFVRAGLVGRVGGLVRYEVSAAVSNGEPELFTAYAEIAPFRFLSLRAGQMRVPFTRQSMTPEEFLSFPDRSLATREFAYLRDIGVSARAHGFQDRLELILGAYNGSGPNRSNDNLDPMLLVRVAGVTMGQPWTPAQGDPGKTRNLSLMLGGTATIDYVPATASYGYLSGSAVPVRPLTDRDRDQDGRLDDVRVIQLAGDLALRFRGLAFECELYQRRENWKTLPSQPGGDPLLVQNQFRGWFAQLSYYILDNRLQVATRASVSRISPLTVGGRVRPEATCTLPDGTASPCHLPYADVRSELAALVALHVSGLRIVGSFARYRWSSDGSTQPPSAIENQLTILTQWIL
jgi:hypothetical protein